MKSDSVERSAFSNFWPTFLLGLAFLVFLGWQVALNVRQYLVLIRLDEQQALLSSEAFQSEARLKALMLEVLDLAKTDADAKRIVLKYNIKFTPDSRPDAIPDLLPLLEKVTPMAPPTRKAIAKPSPDADAPPP